MRGGSFEKQSYSRDILSFCPGRAGDWRQRGRQIAHTRRTQRARNEQELGRRLDGQSGSAERRPPRDEDDENEK